MEANLVGTPIYPTAIKFVLASYPYLFGTQQGEELRAWCTERKWPLVWFLGIDNHGSKNSSISPVGQNHRILDATVGLEKNNQNQYQNQIVTSQINHSQMNSWNNTIVNVTVSPADIDTITSDWEKISDIRRVRKEKGMSGPSYGDMLPKWKTFSASVSNFLHLEPLRSRTCVETTAVIGINADGDCVSSRQLLL